MSSGYFLADTNSLVYAYRAGGPELLDEYINVADGQQREFAITRTIEREIEKGPLGEEILHHLTERGITILSAPETEQRLRAGSLSTKSAGEVSMLEVAAQEHAAGRGTRIWSDDKYFDSQQIMRKAPGAEPITSAGLLNEAYEQEYIDAANHRIYRAGYEAQADFSPGHSARLNTFLTLDPSVPEPDAQAAIAQERTGSLGMRRAGAALGIAGLALEVYDGVESVRTAQRLQGEGNATAAESELIHFGARSVGGWTGAGIGIGMPAATASSV